MDSKTLDSITESIKGKIGEEASAMISDDLGLLFTNNNDTISKINNLENSVEQLKTRNETLVNANSRLLQQIPMIDDVKEEETKKEEVKKSFNFMEMFDEKGHFKKKF